MNIPSQFTDVNDNGTQGEEIFEHTVENLARVALFVYNIRFSLQISNIISTSFLLIGSYQPLLNGIIGKPRQK